MATLQHETPHKIRACCDIPRCVKRRKTRGQENGRFLLTLEFGASDVTVSVNCPECGGNHTMTVAYPNPIAT